MAARSRTNRKQLVEPRDTTVNIRVSRSEKEQLQKLAATVGVSVGGYLLGLALGDSFYKAATEAKPDPAQTRLDV